MNRELLQLAKVYNDSCDVRGWFLSEKLDGMRALWDGGISRGLPSDKVPWANLDRKRSNVICTGLWSRYGNVIHAPDYWLDTLPIGACLDGELYLGRGLFQQLVGIVKRSVNILDTDWKDVQFRVFDSPSYLSVFGITGTINNLNYKKRIDPACMEWVRSRTIVVPEPKMWEQTYKGMLREFADHKIIRIHEQQQLPMMRDACATIIASELDRVVVMGGEGLMVRAGWCIYEPRRTSNILKIKPVLDSEALVIGTSPGKGKYAGMIGSLRVRDAVSGMEFDLSGLTDAERKRVDWVGKTVTYCFRELTDSGLPKEARYVRIV